MLLPSLRPTGSQASAGRYSEQQQFQSIFQNFGLIFSKIPQHFHRTKPNLIGHIFIAIECQLEIVHKRLGISRSDESYEYKYFRYSPKDFYDFAECNEDLADNQHSNYMYFSSGGALISSSLFMT